jgi:hypothetical protein
MYFNVLFFIYVTFDYIPFKQCWTFLQIHIICCFGQAYWTEEPISILPFKTICQVHQSLI